MLQYGLLVPVSKCLDRGETLHPAAVVWNRGLYTCLLEHDLRDPHPVWLPALSPWEIAPVGIIVLQEEPPKSGRVREGRDSEGQARPLAGCRPRADDG